VHQRGEFAVTGDRKLTALMPDRRRCGNLAGLVGGTLDSQLEDE
jgi:hypothetical protein